MSEAAAAPSSAPASTRSPFLSIAEQKARAIEKAKQNRIRKKQRAQQEVQRKKQEAVSAHNRRGNRPTHGVEHPG
jgi:hypothetical protein